jgi:predicted DNA-binding transcriptional regulator AlpA
METILKKNCFTSRVFYEKSKGGQSMATKSNQLPQTGFLRIWQIVGSRKSDIPAIIPIGRSTFLAGVKSVKFPQPVKLGERTTAWRVEDIRNLIISFGGAA